MLNAVKLCYTNINVKVNVNILRVGLCGSLNKFSSPFYEKFTLVKSWSHLKNLLANTKFLLFPK